MKSRGLTSTQRRETFNQTSSPLRAILSFGPNPRCTAPRESTHLVQGQNRYDDPVRRHSQRQRWAAYLLGFESMKTHGLTSTTPHREPFRLDPPSNEPRATGDSAGPDLRGRPHRRRDR